MKAGADPASLVRGELRQLRAYSLDLSPCRHKLDQNEAPFEPPPGLKRRVADALRAAPWARYPDFHADALRRDLGELHGWPAAGVLVGNGSNELLDVCLSALVAPGSEVVGYEPSFALYRMVVLKAGGVPRFLPPAPGLRLPLAALEAEVARDPRRPLLLCAPNNPTGDAPPPEAIDALAARQEGPFLLDNAYGEFCRFDYRPLLARHPHLILLRTFSKAWALAGLRLGYLLADPRLVAELLKVKLPYNVGVPAVLAGRAVLAAAPAARRRISLVVARRAQWQFMLQAAGLQVLPSEANFLLVRCASAAAAAALRDGLAARGIRVRDVGAYPGLAGALRISIGSGAALRATRQALAELLPAGGAGAEPAAVSSEAGEKQAVVAYEAGRETAGTGAGMAGGGKGLAVPPDTMESPIGWQTGAAQSAGVATPGGGPVRESQSAGPATPGDEQAGASQSAGAAMAGGGPVRESQSTGLATPGDEQAGASQSAGAATPGGGQVEVDQSAASAAHGGGGQEARPLPVDAARPAWGDGEGLAAPVGARSLVLATDDGMAQVGGTHAAPPAADAAAAGASEARHRTVERATGETRVRLALGLEGGPRRIVVANGFFGHMLQALATHGGLGLEVEAQGDLHVDLHHTVEDVGIALGQALDGALGGRRGLVRFGTAYAPLDEALARAVVDLSGRGFFHYSAPRDMAAAWVTAEFPLTLVADFFQAFADRGRLTLHLEILAARNGHHAAEAAFKAVALALRQAAALRPAGAGAAPDADVPSTKGTLTA
jgi:histidinol-phosphate aminotransferase